ncbi:MAG: M23 family metallopeptidase [Clostridia bacterium]|nr:M23 family metallopeptidase [Clostridia bacterium]
MSNETKTRRLGGIFYFICVLMLLAILTSAIMSAINNAKRESARSTGKETEQTVSTGETAKTPAPDAGSVYGEITEKKTDTAQTETVTETAETGEEKAASALPTEFTLPIAGMVLKNFYGEVPVFSMTMNDYRTHEGIDLQGEPGTQVKAFADGVVDAIYNNEFMGNTMVVDHGGGLKSYYMNIGNSYPQGIEQGAEVKCGQVIAGVGSGCKLEALEGSHLHFEVSLNGKRVDPLGYIDHATLADYEYEGEEE